MHSPPSRVPDEVAAHLAALTHRQFEIATQWQLAAIGLTQSQLDAQLDARRWRALSATVIALHNGPLTLLQQWAAAVLSADGPCALAGRTAIQAAGMTGWEVDPIHIVVERGAKVNAIKELSLKVHESRRFTVEDIHPTRTPAQIRVERGIVDAAVWSNSARTACGLVAAGVQQRKTTAERLRETLESAGQVRHRRLLLSVLADVEGGAQAVSELDFLRFCRRIGLPRPQLQIRRDRSGRRRYLDATFRSRDGRLVAVEIDGAAHLVVTTYWSDMIRQNDLVIGGDNVLRYPSAYIYANDPVAVAQLREAILLETCQNVAGL
jgi:hypothetical protein